MKTSVSLPTWVKTFGKTILPSHRHSKILFETLEAKSLSIHETHASISRLLNSRAPFFVGRPGGTEAEGLYHFVQTRFSRNPKKFSSTYPSFFRRFATPYSGIIFHSANDLDEFCLDYLRAALEADILSYGDFAPGALGLARVRAMAGEKTTHYRNLEPWTIIDSEISPWTLALRGKKVLVIHPFTDSIRHQFANREAIRGVNRVLPDFEMSLFRPPHTLKTNENSRSWRSTFSELKDAVSAIDFDVALIGAGSYGLPLAHHISRLGKQAIHTAGATQLLFGIKGIRWESNHPVTAIADKTWISPLANDLTPEIRKIDGGSYH